jgi:hypothetical protein
MNVSEQIINVLDNLCQKFGLIIDWSSENVLPYLKELCGRFIDYEIFTSVAWIILTLTLCLLCWIVYAATFKGAKEKDWDDSYFICWANIISVFCAVVSSIIFVLTIGCQIFDIIEAIYLQEKTIYEFINYQISCHN